MAGSNAGCSWCRHWSSTRKSVSRLHCHVHRGIDYAVRCSHDSAWCQGPAMSPVAVRCMRMHKEGTSERAAATKPQLKLSFVWSMDRPQLIVHV